MKKIFQLLIIIISFYFPNIEAYAHSKEKLLLITGCGRSGTMYIAEVLQKCKVDVKHEEMGMDGISSWCCVVTDPRVPAGEPRGGFFFKHIFHQVRNPLKVISSVHASFKPSSWDFILKHVPEIRRADSKIVKSAKYWYYWNLKAEAIAEWRFRVEDMEKSIVEMSKKINRPLDKKVLKDVPTNTHTRNDVDHVFTWKELKEELDPVFFANLQKMALKYGYPITD